MKPNYTTLLLLGLLGLQATAQNLGTKGQFLTLRNKDANAATMGAFTVSANRGISTFLCNMGAQRRVSISAVGSGTLDHAYDFGGLGLGRSITATDGVVNVQGTDGLLVRGTFGSGLAIGAANGIPQGAGTRMFFNPRKAAFRAGAVSGTAWNDASVGAFSFAAGLNSAAGGENSTAMGDSTTASGDVSTAMGLITTASGFVSTAMGGLTTASGISSTAMGSSTTASGDASTAMGFTTTASGANSTAMGTSTTASGTSSTAMGASTTASGIASTAMGRGTTASDIASTAMGRVTTASDIASTAMGRVTTASGRISTAMGDSTTASGRISTAMGRSTTASEFTSTAMGAFTTASGIVSTAMGHSTTASGSVSTATGVQNTAASYGETVVGIGATAYTPSTGGATRFRAANAADRLFVVGNAIDANGNDVVDATERSNALTVLKNGSVGIGTDAPGLRLDVNGGLALSPTTVALTSDNFLLNIGNQSVFLLASDNATAANRTVNLSNGTVPGQIITLINNNTAFAFEMLDSDVNLNIPVAVSSMTGNHSVTLMWTGVLWVQLAFSSNGL